MQGQLADQPLVNSEQFGGGGLTTARGYLEAEELGDNAIFGSLEFRSPSFVSYLPWNWVHAKGNEWRVYAFLDAGQLTDWDTLPEEASRWDLASYGFGSRVKIEDHLNGSIDVAVPVIAETNTALHEVRVIFRLWAEF